MSDRSLPCEERLPQLPLLLAAVGRPSGSKHIWAARHLHDELILKSFR